LCAEATFGYSRSRRRPGAVVPGRRLGTVTRTHEDLEIAVPAVAFRLIPGLAGTTCSTAHKLGIFAAGVTLQPP
jgi:hypothetical protein